jgi:hypothetical protein
MQSTTVRAIKYTVAYLSGFLMVGYFWSEFKSAYILYQQEKSSENLIGLYESDKITKDQADNEKKIDVSGFKMPSHNGLILKYIFKYFFLMIPLTIITWPFILPLVLIPSLFSVKNRLKASEYFQSFGIEPYAASVYDMIPVLPKVTTAHWNAFLSRLQKQTIKSQFEGANKILYEACLLNPQYINLFLQYIKNHEFYLKSQLKIDGKSYVPLRVSKEKSGLPFTFQIALMEGELALIADVKSKKLIDAVHNGQLHSVKIFFEKGAGNYNTVKKSLRLDKEQVLADRVCEQDAPLGIYSYQDQKKEKKIMVSKQRLDKNPKVYYNNALEVSSKKIEGILSYYAGAVYHDRKVGYKRWSLYSDYKSRNLEKHLQTDDFQKSTISEKISLAEKVIKAIFALHRNEIVYVDIKLENILIDEDKNIYLADFDGSAKVGRSIPRNPIVTWIYAAPEIIKRYESLNMRKEEPKTLHLYPHFKSAIDVAHKPNFKEVTTYQVSADNWSLGCILERILLGTGLEGSQVLQNCFNGDEQQRASIGELIHWITTEKKRYAPKIF